MPPGHGCSSSPSPSCLSCFLPSATRQGMCSSPRLRVFLSPVRLAALLPRELRPCTLWDPMVFRRVPPRAWLEEDPGGDAGQARKKPSERSSPPPPPSWVLNQVTSQPDSGPPGLPPPSFAYLELSDLFAFPSATKGTSAFGDSVACIPRNPEWAKGPPAAFRSLLLAQAV